jgi:hypothetical protein
MLRFASTGTLQWSRGYNGAFSPRSLASDGASLYLGGTWDGAQGLMAAAISPTGTLLWTSAWGNGSTQGSDIAVDGGQVCISGLDDSGSVTRALVARFNTAGGFSAAGEWNSASGLTRASGLSFGGGYLHIAGAAPSAPGSYSAATGSSVASSLATFNPTLATRTPLGVAAWVTGVEGPANGVSDTGAGGSDMLILKDFQL